MRPAERELAVLRAAFAADGDAGGAGPQCPAPEALFDALHGVLPAPERVAVIEHVAACAACAADWQLAAGVAPAARPTRQPRAAWAMAAAALLVAAVGLAVLERGPRDASPVYRAAPRAEIRAVTPAGAALPRERFVLRWTAPAAGARFAIEAATPDLQRIAAAHGLERPEYQVPAAALAPYPARQQVVWRVEARWPDGRRLASPGFVNTIE